MIESSSYVLGAFLSILFIFYQKSHLFYETEKFFCDKYCGHCEKCDCWSCKRKYYIDEYKDYKSDEYVNFKHKRNILEKLKDKLFN